MAKKTLLHTVSDFNNNLIAYAGQRITLEFLEKIIRNSNIPKESITISHTAILNDLRERINCQAYRTIFSGDNDPQNILSIAGNTEIPKAIADELSRMKKNIPDNYIHILTVTALAIKIALEYQREDDLNLSKISEIGFLHDIGKSRLPYNILEKKEPLTRKEFKAIQNHPIIDYVLASYYLHDPRSFVARTSFSHHERLDGSGYPRGIRIINSYVKLIIPCDIFDALISQRPYRNEPFTVRAALDLLLDEAREGRIDQKYVFCLIRCARKDKPPINNIKLAEQHRDPPPKINNYGVRAD